MNKFITDNPESIHGKLSIDELDDGTYRCVTVCRLTGGEEFTVRDFSFDA